MKKLLIITAILIAQITMAQSGFNYKALITQNTNVLSNQSVDLRFTILQNGTTSVYQETHTATTDANGIVSVSIGEGSVVSGDFSTIDWSNDYALKVEIDTGSGFQDFGTNALKYVPFAKYAEAAGNTFSGDFNDLSNVPAGLSDGDDVNDADHDATNEIQSLSLTGMQLAISNGNTVNFAGWDTDVSDDFNGNYDNLSGKPDVFHIDNGSNNTATGYTENIKHRGNMFIGENFNAIGAGKSTLRINRYENNQDSYGITSVVSGSGVGSRFGGYFVISGNGTGEHYGIVSYVISSGDGYHQGTFNGLTGSGTGTQVGTQNYISNDGSGSHYGSLNTLSGSGSGAQYGTENYISVTGEGNHYGSYSYLSGSGSGNKYGVYANIPTTAGGTHYAIYGSAEKSGSYAGYFKGDVRVTKKIIAPASGNTDMKAYIYGYVNQTGGVRPSASSSGFIVTKTATGIYKIDFSDLSSNTNLEKYIVIVTKTNITSPRFLSVYQNDHKFYVYIYDINGVRVDGAFNFVVFKK